MPACNTTLPMNQACKTSTEPSYGGIMAQKAKGKAERQSQGNAWKGKGQRQRQSPTSAHNVAPSILSWNHHWPICICRVVEDIRSRVVVVVCLGREHKTDSVIHDTRQSLHEELGWAHHVRIKHSDQLQSHKRCQESNNHSRVSLTITCTCHWWWLMCHTCCD